MKAHAFYPTWGTPVFLAFDATPYLIAFPAASLDEPARFDPRAVTCNIRGHRRDTLDGSLQVFEKMAGRVAG